MRNVLPLNAASKHVGGHGMGTSLEMDGAAMFSALDERKKNPERRSIGS